MSDDCTSICILCRSPQEVKINFVMSHGTCSAHSQDLNSAIMACIHCKNIIPVNKKTPKQLCKDCNNQTFQGKYDCEHVYCLGCISEDFICKICHNSISFPGVPYECFECKASTENSPFPCGHRLCEKCLKIFTTCSVCFPVCRACNSFNVDKKLSCGHYVCTSCNKKDKCSVCNKNQNKNVSTKGCLKCLVI
jgi:hypothetical protein